MTTHTETIDARAVFYKVFGDSQNFMTPTVIEYRIVGGYAIEISTGTALLDPMENLYGVTVLELDGTRTDLGGCFNSPQDALEYIDGLNG